MYLAFASSILRVSTGSRRWWRKGIRLPSQRGFQDHAGMQVELFSRAMVTICRQRRDQLGAISRSGWRRLAPLQCACQVFAICSHWRVLGRSHLWWHHTFRKILITSPF